MWDAVAILVCWAPLGILLVGAAYISAPVCIIAGIIKLCDDHDLSSRQVARRKAMWGQIALAAVFAFSKLGFVFR